MMGVPLFSPVLRDRLGREAADDLAQTLARENKDMFTATQERFEARLSTVAAELRGDMARMESGLRQDMTRLQAALRQDMASMESGLRRDMADIRVDVIRWSFVFWIGQVAATAAILALMFRSFLPR